MKNSLRPQQAADFLGMARVTFYRYLKERPDFPKPRKLSPRCVVFDADELLAWRDNQQTAKAA